MTESSLLLAQEGFPAATALLCFHNRARKLGYGLTRPISVLSGGVEVRSHRLSAQEQGPELRDTEVLWVFTRW